jgi:folate-binding protein YgfZ
MLASYQSFGFTEAESYNNSFLDWFSTMTLNWNSVVEQQQSAPFPAENQSSIAAISSLSVMTVAGDDAADFLQSMLSNDVKALTDNQAVLAGFCNPKGRLLAVLTVIRSKHRFICLLPSDIAESVAQRLKMFVLRSKVSIEIESNLLLAALETTQPPSDSVNDALIVAQANQSQRFWLLADQTTMNQQLEKLTGLVITSQQYWHFATLNTGQANVYASSKELFTPQQINLDLLGGVSFKKGCYPGQEVVARLHYLGSPSRRLFSAIADSAEKPEAGEEVCGPQGTVLGHVVNAEHDASGQLHLLLSLKLAEADKPAVLKNGAKLGQLHRLIEEQE